MCTYTVFPQPTNNIRKLQSYDERKLKAVFLQDVTISFWKFDRIPEVNFEDYKRLVVYCVQKFQHELSLLTETMYLEELLRNMRKNDLINEFNEVLYNFFKR